MTYERFSIVKDRGCDAVSGERGRLFSTEIIQFVDGSEQRYRNFSGALLRWAIRLANLDEDELGRIEAFYAQEQGEFGTFSFTDPWDGTEYPECQFENEEILAEFLEFQDGRTNLRIRQVR